MMERITHTALWVLILAIIGVGGYFAYTQLNHDFVYENDTIAMNDDTELELNFDPVEDAIADVETTDEDSATSTEDEPAVGAPGGPAETVTPDSNANPEYDELIGRIERLIEDEVFMKVGSRGTRVGTVQEFLNIYNGTDSRIDNDYGNGTKDKVQKFQSAEGLGADGQAGPNTYNAMIDWLKEQ
jgi:murein L,D-transpeptidase YcbB/YkuD